jgi:ABC-type multidrug transport system ATPase subunit
MNTASQNLEYILTINELSRENDKRLISEYLKEFHCKSNTEKAIIERIINEAPNL